MRHFKDVTGAVFAIESDGSQDHLILEGWQEIDAAEVAVLTAPDAPTPEQVRDEKLRSLVHDYGDGRVIQCRPAKFAQDESNMRNAIEEMLRNGDPSMLWLMADDSVGPVTPADLQSALESGQDQAKAVWAEFFAAIGGGV